MDRVCKLMQIILIIQVIDITGQFQVLLVLRVPGMSDLYRSAISARIAKLPDLPHSEDDDDVSGEGSDSLGSLPGSGMHMGPPAMQVQIQCPRICCI